MINISWEHDLCRGIKINYDFHCAPESEFLSNFDYVIDCTGLHRSLLPKSPQDFIIPSYEYLVDNVDGVDEFYVIGYKGAQRLFLVFSLR